MVQLLHLTLTWAPCHAQGTSSLTLSPWVLPAAPVEAIKHLALLHPGLFRALTALQKGPDGRISAATLAQVESALKQPAGRLPSSSGGDSSDRIAAHRPDSQAQYSSGRDSCTQVLQEGSDDVFAQSRSGSGQGSARPGSSRRVSVNLQVQVPHRVSDSSTDGTSVTASHEVTPEAASGQQAAVATVQRTGQHVSFTASTAAEPPAAVQPPQARKPGTPFAPRNAGLISSDSDDEADRQQQQHVHFDAKQLQPQSAAVSADSKKRAGTPGAGLGRPASMFHSSSESDDEAGEQQQHVRFDAQQLQLLGAADSAGSKKRAGTPGAGLGHPVSMFHSSSESDDEAGEQQQHVHFDAKQLQPQGAADSAGGKKRAGTPGAGLGRPASMFHSSSESDDEAGEQQQHVRFDAQQLQLQGAADSADSKKRAGTPGAGLGRPVSMFHSSSESDDEAGEQQQHVHFDAQQLQPQGAADSAGSKKRPGTPGAGLGRPASMFHSSSESDDEAAQPQQQHVHFDAKQLQPQGAADSSGSKKRPGTPGAGLARPASMFDSSSESNSDSGGGSSPTPAVQFAASATYRRSSSIARVATPWQPLSGMHEDGSSGVDAATGSSSRPTAAAEQPPRVQFEAEPDSDDGVSTARRQLRSSGSIKRVATPWQPLSSMHEGSGDDSMDGAPASSSTCAAAEATGRVQFQASPGAAAAAAAAAASCSNDAQCQPSSPSSLNRKATPWQPLPSLHADSSSDSIDSAAAGNPAAQAEAAASPHVHFQPGSAAASGSCGAASARRRPGTPGAGLIQRASMFKNGSSDEEEAAGDLDGSPGLPEPVPSGEVAAVPSPEPARVNFDSSAAHFSSAAVRAASKRPVTPGAGLGKPVSIFSRSRGGSDGDSADAMGGGGHYTGGSSSSHRTSGDAAAGVAVTAGAVSFAVPVGEGPSQNASSSKVRLRTKTPRAPVMSQQFWDDAEEAELAGTPAAGTGGEGNPQQVSWG
jgi:hypothetical protein